MVLIFSQPDQDIIKTQRRQEQHVSFKYENERLPVCRRPKKFISGILQNEFIHEYDVAQASRQHKQMEDLMASEVPVSAVEQRQLQRIDHASDRIDDASAMMITQDQPIAI